MEIKDIGDGPVGFVPDALRSLVVLHDNVLDFHSSLATPDGNHHPWESKPWTWPMGLRPMLYCYERASTYRAAGVGVRRGRPC